MRTMLCCAVLGVFVLACAGGTPSLGTAGSAGLASPTAPATAAPTAAPTAPAAPSPIVIGPAEPWILYGRYVSNDVKAVFLMRPDGTDSHRILKELGDIRAATWSSDGSKIAFVYRGPGAAKDGEIWTAAPDGSGAKRLFDPMSTCTGAFHPSWSPDDRHMAFICYTDTEDKLATIDLETNEITILFSTQWPNHLDNPPSWSPDGKTIAFDILHYDPTDSFLDGSLIATIQAGGGKVWHVTELDSFAAYPDWTSDGKELIYNDYDQGNMVTTEHSSNLWAIGPDGTGRRQITDRSIDGSYRITQARVDPGEARYWVTIWTPGSGIHVGWVDPATGMVTRLNTEGSVPQPRPTPEN